MSFSIGNTLKNLGFNLPKIDLGGIGKAVLNELKDVGGQVLKDSFELDSDPSKVLNEKLDLNVLGAHIRMPNPLTKLANKLLGDVDGKLGGFGVNVDFRKLLGNVFHLKTADGGTVEVPPIKNRMADLTAANAGIVPADVADASGSGAVDASFAKGDNGGVAVPPTKGGGDTGGVTTSDSPAGAPVDVSGGNAVFGGGNLDMGGIYGNMSKLEGTMNDAINKLSSLDPNSKDYQAQLFKLQNVIQGCQRLFDAMSSIFKSMHETKSSIIRNIG